MVLKTIVTVDSVSDLMESLGLVFTFIGAKKRVKVVGSIPMLDAANDVGTETFRVLILKRSTSTSFIERSLNEATIRRATGNRSS